MSVIVDVEEEAEDECLDELKMLLNSQIGVISYVNPAYFTDGQDFADRYG
ncbi:hypothetical protein [Hymenobacter chitinivorans]|nr:hypothetical protein [Hymenobacter chitinivorans]